MKWLLFTLSGVGLCASTAQAQNFGNIAPAVPFPTSEIPNIIQYGADPTGAADSTAAINQCFALPACFVPVGTFKAASNLAGITTYNHAISGAGPGVSGIM